jgi:hypothetical protein
MDNNAESVDAAESLPYIGRQEESFWPSWRVDLQSFNNGRERPLLYFMLIGMLASSAESPVL